MVSGKIQRNLAVIVTAIALGTVLVLFVPAFNAVKREDSRAQAEYAVETEAFEQSLESRHLVRYKVQEGEGINHAFIASGIKPELGRTDSMKYEVCKIFVLRKNGLRSGSLPSGSTISVPSGAKKTAQK